jgi:deoxyguanosine kinase
MKLQQLRYVVVEGAIGVGKTTLTQQLAHLWAADSLLEAPEDNPFLDKFYQDRSRYALPTQLTYLFQRADQLAGLAQRDLFAPPLVADFILDKDPLFARMTLSDDEYQLYCKLYNHLRPTVAQPDLVILLQASVETLLNRIKQRGVGYEQGMDADYLSRLSAAYNELFFRYDAAPVLIVNTEHLNFAQDIDSVFLLIEQIKQLQSPRAYFNYG